MNYREGIPGLVQLEMAYRNLIRPGAEVTINYSRISDVSLRTCGAAERAGSASGGVSRPS